jgi:misacylated tRNA(Ala) deacylase
MSAKVLSSVRRSGASTIVGLLACQADPYLQTLKTKVVACQKTDKCYEVEFENTVLFPEGGGQPFDTGSVIYGSKEIPVRNVQRDGLTAVHLIDEELPKEAEVELKVDWPRRWDHMQQHTGQHLVSAVLDKRNLETVGWNLGAKFNYIELPRKLTSDEVIEVQQEVNDYINDAIHINVENHHEQHQDSSIDHSVPENYDLSKGVIRVIHIGEVDANPCCGTHLKNTAEIGSVALLHSQPIRGTNSRLFFICGDRVPKYAAEANDIVRRANAALSCQSEEIEDKINRLTAQVKELSAKERFWSSQVAAFEAQSIRSRLGSGKVCVLHKPEGSMDYLKNIEKELGKLNVGDGTVILMSGLGKQGGSLVIFGDNVEQLAGAVKEVVSNVKGGGKGKWQGKVPVWEKGAIDGVLKLVI